MGGSAGEIEIGDEERRVPEVENLKGGTGKYYYFGREQEIAIIGSRRSRVKKSGVFLKEAWPGFFA